RSGRLDRNIAADHSAAAVQLTRDCGDRTAETGDRAVRDDGDVPLAGDGTNAAEGLGGDLAGRIDRDIAALGARIARAGHAGIDSFGAHAIEGARAAGVDVAHRIDRDVALVVDKGENALAAIAGGCEIPCRADAYVALDDVLGIGRIVE